jgi:hypothetical protein
MVRLRPFLFIGLAILIVPLGPFRSQTVAQAFAGVFPLLDSIITVTPADADHANRHFAAAVDPVELPAGQNGPPDPAPVTVGGGVWEAPTDALVEIPLKAMIYKPCKSFGFLLLFESPVGTFEGARPAPFVTIRGPASRAPRTILVGPSFPGAVVQDTLDRQLSVIVDSPDPLPVGPMSLAVLKIRFHGKRDGAQSLTMAPSLMEGAEVLRWPTPQSTHHFGIGIPTTRGPDAGTIREVRPFQP